MELFWLEDLRLTLSEHYRRRWGLGVFKAVTDPSIDKLPNWSPKGTRHPSSSAVNRRQSRRDNLLVLWLFYIKTVPLAPSFVTSLPLFPPQPRFSRLARPAMATDPKKQDDLLRRPLYGMSCAAMRGLLLRIADTTLFCSL